MEVGEISAIKHNPHHRSNPALIKKELLTSARNLLRDDVLLLRPTDSRIVSSQAGQSINGKNSMENRRVMRSINLIASEPTEQRYDQEQSGSETAKTVVRERGKYTKVESSGRTCSVKKRTKIFPSGNQITFKIPLLRDYYCTKHSFESCNALNLSFAEDIKGTSGSNMLDSLKHIRGQRTMRSIKSKTCISQLENTQNKAGKQSEKDGNKSLIMWVSFMMSVMLIIVLRAFMFL